MKEIVRSVLVFVVMSVFTGIAYPYVITALSHLEFRKQANGSMVVAQGRTIGSSLIGQQFSGPAYFHGRPSALEKAYDASSSGGSNSGPSNAKFLAEVRTRATKIREENGLSSESSIPADLVLASGSGLDPHISLQSAMIQTGRVAKIRRLAESEVQGLVERHMEGSQFGFIGDNRVNVLLLNMDLDELSRTHQAGRSK
jgi:potassium-transporting ATPase KdpC subunit